ncbi:MAG: acyltransferase [Candidatus Omnitrophica bacterium]|nr:acyltransferase [Candidatus Omnitrophota bacterium]
MDMNDITGNWDYSTLAKNVHIGKNCWLERKESFARFRSVKEKGLVLGDGVIIYTWATFNVEPEGVIEIGDNSILVGPVFMCADSIKIGKNVVISYYVTIADSDFHPKDPELRKLDAIANAPYGDKSTRPPITTKSVVIEDDVWIGIGAIILKGVRIGKGARIGAGAVLAGDVAAGATVEGNPARIRKD